MGTSPLIIKFHGDITELGEMAAPSRGKYKYKPLLKPCGHKYENPDASGDESAIPGLDNSRLAEFTLRLSDS